MGISDSVPLKPEQVQTFTAERLETMLEQASSLYGDEAEVGDPDHNVNEEVEAIKVKYEQEIFDLKTEMNKKDELQREMERTLNELKWDLNKEMKMKDELQKETEKNLNVAKKKLEEQIEESTKKTKEIIRLKTKFNKLDKLMNDHEKLKEEEITKMKEQCDLQMAQHELKFTFLQRKYDELNENHTKALVSLDFVELRGNIYEINKDLLRKELDELKSENNRLNSEPRFMKQVENLNKDLLRKGINEPVLRKQVEDLKSENIGLKNWKELNNALVSKEVNELTEFKNKNLKEETTLKKKVEDLNLENIRLKFENDSLKKQIAFNTRFRDLKSGN